MRKLFLCLSAVAVNFSVNAQNNWTSTSATTTTTTAVGIGTATTPNYIPLHVVADESLFGGSGIVTSFERISPQAQSTGKFNLLISDIDDGFGDVLMDAQGNADIALRTQGGSGGVLVLKKNGTVGIGTSSPSTDAAVKLHIKGAASASQNAQILIESSETQALRFTRSGVNTWIMGRRANDNAFAITDSYFFNGSTEKFTINSLGYVGIGVPYATAMLDVAGSAKFKDGVFINRDGDGYLAFANNGTNVGQVRANGVNGLGFYSTVLSTHSLFANNSNGRIGIGTTTPDAKLHVNGTLRFSGNGEGAGKVLTSDANGYATWQSIESLIPFVSGGPLAGSVPAVWNQDDVTNDISFTLGKVGIGVEVPEAQLHIETDGTSPANSLLIKTTGANNADIAFKSGTSESDLLFYDNSNNAIATLTVGKNINGATLSFKDKINSKEVFKIVNGSVYAHEVVVQLADFPDYVFGKDYKLTTPEVLENQIKTLGHLPNVPSAEEIEANGVGLAQLTRIQMEKIEELTLYMIQQQKRIVALEGEVKNLSEQK